MEILVTALIVGIVIHGLDRNRARQAALPHPHLAGSSDVVDRDSERLAGELLSRHSAVPHS